MITRFAHIEASRATICAGGICKEKERRRCGTSPSRLTQQHVPTRCQLLGHRHRHHDHVGVPVQLLPFKASSHSRIDYGASVLIEPLRSAIISHVSVHVWPIHFMKLPSNLRYTDRRSHLAWKHSLSVYSEFEPVFFPRFVFLSVRLCLW